MKAIMMSIRPQWVAKILNKEKTIEIRKKFPKDYVGWVYIYCTKTIPYLTRGVRGDVYPSCVSSQGIVPHHLNSRVVARFWCDKVEEIKRIYPSWDTKIFAWETETFAEGEIENKACLSSKELRNYLAFKQIGYAIHITKLEIFDKTKEIDEFYTPFRQQYMKDVYAQHPLTRAPQSYCFIEI